MAPTRVPPPWLRWILLGALAMFHVAVVISLSKLMKQASGAEVSLYWGLCCGQVSVAAILATISGQRWVTRNVIALSLVALNLLPIIGHTLRTNELEAGIMVDCALLAQFGAIQVAIWLTHLFLMKVPNNRTGEGNSRVIQFGVRDLLLWTSAIACFLGATRIFIPKDHWRPIDFATLIGMGFAFLLFSGFQTLVPLPTIMCFVLRQPVWVRWLVGVAGTFLVSMIQVPVFTILGLGGPNPAQLGLLNVAHVGWLLMSLSILRYCESDRLSDVAEAKRAST